MGGVRSKRRKECSDWNARNASVNFYRRGLDQSVSAERSPEGGKADCLAKASYFRTLPLQSSVLAV